VSVFERRKEDEVPMQFLTWMPVAGYLFQTGESIAAAGLVPDNDDAKLYATYIACS
jgi:hypothetical protein